MSCPRSTRRSGSTRRRSSWGSICQTVEGRVLDPEVPAVGSGPASGPDRLVGHLERIVAGGRIPSRRAGPWRCAAVGFSAPATALGGLCDPSRQRAAGRSRSSWSHGARSLAGWSMRGAASCRRRARLAGKPEPQGRGGARVLARPCQKQWRRPVPGRGPLCRA